MDRAARHKVPFTGAAVLLVFAWAGAPAWADDPAIQVNPVTHISISGEVSIEGRSESPSMESLPAGFTLEPVGVTPIKNQGACGSCWAFAAYGSMESNLKYKTGVTADLSENNLKNRHGFDLGPCAGGNVWMSMAYLSRLSGPLAESYDPYHAWDDRATAPTTGPRQYSMTSVPFHTAVSTIKQGVVDHGALYTSMYFDNAYYNSTTKTYYYGGTTGTNHAVCVVGWDDTKAVPGAPAAGAWRIRNSWGPAWGDAGYFWLSYDDSQGGKYGAAVQAGPVSLWQRAYSYDQFGDVTELNCPYACNVFRTSQVEQLKAIGFYTQVDGASYDLRIYDNWVAGNPANLLIQKTGTMPEWGFQTVDLGSLLNLPANDTFVVYLKITNGGSYPQAIDYRVAGYDSASTANPGESYYSFDGLNWTDVTSWDQTANFSIKAYTVPEPATLCLLALGALALVRRRAKN